jgi:hypothetical protein
VLARLIASVAHPDHVADLSRRRDVDIEVRWFDPQTHDVATTGRLGNVTHVLDGRQVPYVARPYKTILLSGDSHWPMIDGLVPLAQMFDLNSSAMKATLNALVETSELVKEVNIAGTRIEWVVNINGQTLRTTGTRDLSRWWGNLILLELAGVHARYHAHVEPTFLLLDEMLFFIDSKTQVDALDRLEKAAEHAQVAVISTRPITEARDWTLTTLDSVRLADSRDPKCSIDFEIETKPIEGRQ